MDQTLKITIKKMNSQVIKFFVVFAGLSLLTIGSVSANDFDVSFQYEPLFDEANFLPGDAVTRYVEVTNNTDETQTVGTRLEDFSDPGGLGDMINMRIYEEGKTENIFDGTLKKLNDDSSGGLELSNLDDDDNTKYYFEAIFEPTADDDYQGKEVGFDIAMGWMDGEENEDRPRTFTALGGPVYTEGLRIFEEEHKDITETNAVITWRTNLKATSQIIYSSEEEGHELDEDNPPLYGYAHAHPVPEDSTLKTGHEIELLDLEPCTTYYYRIVAKESPSSKPTISKEFSFMSSCVLGETTTTDEVIEEEGGATTPSPTPSGPTGPSGEVAGEWDEEEEPEEEPEKRTEGPSMAAGVSDIFEDVGIVCYFCFPWWVLLIIAAIPMVLSLFNRERTRNLLIKHWAPWSAILVILALIFYLMEWYCVPVIVFLLIFLFTVFYNFFFIPGEKVSRWEGSIERTVETGKERKKYVLGLGLLTFLLLFIVWFFLKCFYLWVLAIIAVAYLLINEIIRSRIRK
jgi:hypothetical protein